MSEQSETTISILSGVVEQAQRRVHAMGMQNVHGLDPAALIRTQTEYDKAREELRLAMETLRDAIRRSDRI